jgi:hypothetical protein
MAALLCKICCGCCSSRITAAVLPLTVMLNSRLMINDSPAIKQQQQAPAHVGYATNAVLLQHI